MTESPLSPPGASIRKKRSQTPKLSKGVSLIITYLPIWFFTLWRQCRHSAPDIRGAIFISSPVILLLGAVFGLLLFFHAARERAAALQRARLNLASRQLKTHFLHNALLSIKVLCRTDPPAAEQALFDLAAFLRSGMDASSSSLPVPFSRELEAVEAYLRIQRLRYGPRLEVIWDIQETDFLLPPLTLQPLVENAVCHGVCQKPEGGTVTVSSHREQERIRIEIRDDGAGFDPASQPEGLSLRCLRLCLREELGGTLAISSTPGVGTIQTISIPVKGGHAL